MRNVTHLQPLPQPAVDDALRAVTRHAVKAARLKEVKLELI